MADFTVGTVAVDTSVQTLEVPVPTHSEGDALILLGYGADNQNLSTPETGFTEEIERIIGEYEGSDGVVACFYKYAGASEPANLTLDISGGVNVAVMWGVCIAVHDIDDGQIMDVSATTRQSVSDVTGENANSDSLDLPSITTVTNGCLIMTCCGAQQCDTNPASRMTPPSGHTLEVNEGTGAFYFGVSSFEQATDGEHDPGTWDGFGTGGDSNGFTIALRIAAPAGEVFNRVLTENTVVTDPVPGYQLTQERPANSNVSILTDALFLYYAFARLAAENFSVTDAYIMEQNLRRDLADVVSVPDAIAILHERFRELSDSLAVEDDYVKQVTIGDQSETFFRTRKENIALTDSLDAVFIGITNRELSDSLLVNEAAFLQRFKTLSIADQIAFASELLNLTHSKVRRDALQTYDSFIVTELRIRNVTTCDSFSLVDLLDQEVTGIRRKKLVDTLAAEDAISHEQGSLLQPSVQIEVGIEER